MKKYKKLRNYFREKNIIVSYSGGIDSLLVAKISSDNAKNFLAITIDNGFFSRNSIDNAINLAKKYNLRHEIVTINYMHDDSIISKINKDFKNRCYFCKKIMAHALINKKNELVCGGKLKNTTKHPNNTLLDDVIVVDGTNYNDLFENRPGIKAYKEYGIKSPLAELKFSKDDIVTLSRYLNIDIPKEDSCLATRILSPPITEKKLRMVETAEKFLASFLNIKGYKNNYLRVRYFHGMAILELRNNHCNYGINLSSSELEIITKKFKEIGFKKCVMDLDIE